MIWIGIYKFARERNLSMGAGFAYGRIGKQYIAMDEGVGYKRLLVYLYPPMGEDDEARDAAILAALKDCDLKEFRLHQYGAVTILDGVAQLMFYDTVDTMKRMIRYIDEILPRLDDVNPDSNRCAQCGGDLGDDAAFVLLDNRVVPMHGSCASSLEADVIREEEKIRAEGSLSMGILGALAGGLIGAALYVLLWLVIWHTAAVVLAGLVTGSIASKLYDLLGGKKTKWKMLIVAVALVMAVLLGQVTGYSVGFAQVYDAFGYTADEISCMDYVEECWEMYLICDQETALSRQYDRRLGDVPEAMRISREDYIRMNYMQEKDEIREIFRAQFMANLRMGLLLGMLGCLGVFWQMYRKNQGAGMRRLR